MPQNQSNDQRKHDLRVKIEEQNRITRQWETNLANHDTRMKKMGQIMRQTNGILATLNIPYTVDLSKFKPGPGDDKKPELKSCERAKKPTESGYKREDFAELGLTVRTEAELRRLF